MKSLFVVEDDKGIRSIVEMILTEEGYDIESFENTRSFFIKLQTSFPDLILLDVNLPDGDGRQICDILKRNVTTRHIPVLIMSAVVKLEDILKDTCADGFLQKPFEIEDLIYTIKNAFK